MNATTRPTRTAPAPAQQMPVQELQRQSTGAESSTHSPIIPYSNAGQLAVPKKVYPPKIAKALLAVARKINPVEKAGVNDFHGYAYPKWEDIRDELWPLINENSLIIIQNEKSHEGLTTDMIAITYSFTILNEEDEVWPDQLEATAICKIRDGKGTLDDKAASKCRTQAEKNVMVQLFKIRTEEVYEVDNQGKVNRNSPRRPVPAPDGALAPHFVPIIAKEHPSAWAERFVAMLTHAKKPEDIDEWYAKNEAVFAKLQAKPEYQEVYDGLVEAMDKRTIEIAPNPKDEKRQQGDDGGFPGDKAMPDIPENLRRTAPLPVSDRDKEWLRSLEEAFQQCTTTEELAAEQDSMMMPAKDTVPVHVWEAAVSITKRELERIQRA